MNAKRTELDDLDSIITARCTEDPYRLPHEKETAIHLPGDCDYISVTSFKKVVFTKLLERDDFEVSLVTIRDADGRESTVNSLEEALSDPLDQIIGISGKLPVGALKIGAARQSNSHSRIVK